ncbi:MAG: ABC transporter ATP-binding protein [Pseudomonadota bacterium]
MNASADPSLIEKAKAALHIRRALRLVWEAAPGWTVASFALVLLQAAIPVLALYLIKLVIDAVTAAAGASPGEADVRSVFVLLGFAGLLTLSGVAIQGLATWIREAQSLLVTDHVLDVLHRKSAAVDYAYYEDPRYHDTLHRAQQEAPSRPTQIVGNLTQVGQSALTAVGILILLATMHWVLTLVLFIAVLPALLVRIHHGRRLYRWQRQRAAMERKARYVGWLLTLPFHAKELRIFNLGEELRHRFRELQGRIRRERLALARHRETANVLAQLLAGTVVFGSLAFVAWRATKGMLTIGDLVMYFGAIQRAQTSLRGLFSGLGALYEDNLFLSTFSEFVDLEDSVVAPPSPTPVPNPVQQGLHVRGVSFQYPHSKEPALRNVDLHVAPGEMVALVGSNGSGKTSLIKLLCRLYDPDGGSIDLDGTDLREMDPDEYRRRIAVVFQDYTRYGLAVSDNIGFGDVDQLHSTERIKAAAREAGVDEALAHLPQGYDTILGRYFPEGEELSIGEWQKVALARAFFSRADILIADEPTSSLDAEAEASVFKMIRRLARDRAAVVVSHRFSTVRMADRIYVLDQGRVVEVGSHDELMAMAGRYARLFAIQAAPYLPEAEGQTVVEDPGSGPDASLYAAPDVLEERRD